jgi:hypothetical protein
MILIWASMGRRNICEGLDAAGSESRDGVNYERDMYHGAGLTSLVFRYEKGL